MGEAPATAPSWKSVHETDSPGARILVSLLNWCCTGPSAPPVWCNSPAVETFGSYPWAVSSPRVLICSQTKSYRWLCFLPRFARRRGVESLKVTGRSSSVGPCRMPLLTHGGLFNTWTLLFLLPPAAWWDFSRGRKCARSSAINPVHYAFLWRAVHTGRHLACS